MNYEERVNALRQELGQRIQDARKRAKLTQQQLATALSDLTGTVIGESRIGNYEQGTRLPDPITVHLIAQILGTTASALYGLPENDLSQEELALVNKYRQTDDRGRRVIQGVAESQPDVGSGYETKKAGRG